MSIDNLFRQLKDVQYQAEKMLKLNTFEKDEISRFTSFVERLRSDLIGMQLNEELGIYVNDITRINEDYLPKVPFLVYVLTILTFGWFIKRYREKMVRAFYREEVKKVRAQFAHIEYLLNEL